MVSPAVQSQVEGILVDLLQVDPRDVRMGTFMSALLGQRIDEGEDGAALVELLEERFRVSIEPEHLVGVDTVEDLVSLIDHEYVRVNEEPGVGGL